jgi:Asp-tRNA(Asn)/Glu-tRNA(Gln) amidotransferase A subunit family amidase
MSTSTSSPSTWQNIAARKQAARDALIPAAWRLPSRSLPKDPPLFEYGPQSVLSVPRECGLLDSTELQITEGYTIKSLLSALSSQKLSSVAVTTAFCKRAAIAQQLTNCITEPLFKSAITRAKQLDEYLRENGRLWGPLHGLPVSVKDTFNIKGVDTSIGLASLCFKPATSNSPLIDLLHSLGCVIITKTNIPQTLASLDSVNNVFGRCMNPANRLMTAGGSSGGEGVIVAMKGCMLGWGTDVGGSIRVPAMCNGVYGLKPSNGRIPYGNQAQTSTEGSSRLGVQAGAGPLGRSMEDIHLVMREIVPISKMWGEDCLPGTWSPTLSRNGSGKHGEFVIGVLRSDGNCELLPPISNILTEVGQKLLATKGIEVIELPTPQAWTKCQSLMSKLMGVDGGSVMADMINATGEPVVPWMKTRMRVGKPRSLREVADLQTRRAVLEREMLDVWNETDSKGAKRRRIDAIICPLAAHPVPEIERYNAVGYTSSFVLLDYPAGVLPIRPFDEADLELGKAMRGEAISSWDEKNRELWDERTVNRKVYLGTTLSIQVITPKLEDLRVVEAMALIDEAVKSTGPKAKL